jgi:hypothetical protein
MVLGKTGTGFGSLNCARGNGNRPSNFLYTYLGFIVLSALSFLRLHLHHWDLVGPGKFIQRTVPLVITLLELSFLVTFLLQIITSPPVSFFFLPFSLSVLFC